MKPIERIIDANLNRAREALRVMEDIARFVLDDADLAPALKSLRHDLTEAVEALGLGRDVLLSSRDAHGDVGREVSTEQEGERSGLAGIAGAAASRLTEALRSLEEAAKVIENGRRQAARFEAMRYRAYDLDRSLSLALAGADGDSGAPLSDAEPPPSPRSARPEAKQWRLCVLITESICTHHAWQEVAIEALAAGADCLQLREKELSDSELLRRARVLVGLTRDHGADLVINDRPDVALIAGASGVHLGQHDLPVDEVRRFAGDRLLLGVSCAEFRHVGSGVRLGADVFGLGPVYPSTTKPKSGVNGPEFLRQAIAMLDGRPHLAISGIDGDNIGEIVQAGCRGVAVSSFVCSSERPGVACERLLQVLTG